MFCRAVLLRLEENEKADVTFAVPFVYAVVVRSEAQTGAVFQVGLSDLELFRLCTL